MALVESFMLPLGTALPDLAGLEITNGKALPKQHSELTVISVICNHCPYVIHIAEAFAKVLNQLHASGINCVAISSNNIATHPQDAPDKMADFSAEHKFVFPYGYDASQNIAKSLMAECTPEFYVFHKTEGLIYRGEFCDSRIGNNIAPSGKSVLKAIELYTTSQTILTEQKPSMGCSIKWK